MPANMYMHLPGAEDVIGVNSDVVGVSSDVISAHSDITFTVGSMLQTADCCDMLDAEASFNLLYAYAQ